MTIEAVPCCCNTTPICGTCSQNCGNAVLSVKWTGSVLFSSAGICNCLTPLPAGVTAYATYSSFIVADGATRVLVNQGQTASNCFSIAVSPNSGPDPSVSQVWRNDCTPIDCNTLPCFGFCTPPSRVVSYSLSKPAFPNCLYRLIISFEMGAFVPANFGTFGQLRLLYTAPYVVTPACRPTNWTYNGAFVGPLGEAAIGIGDCVVTQQTCPRNVALIGSINPGIVEVTRP